jgi:hypothetical protein
MMGGKVWKLLGGEPQTRSQTVLSRCKKGTVDCWRSNDHHIRVAVFLQSHSDGSGAQPPGYAKVCIAYESYHPAPMKFTRTLAVAGGLLGKYDSAEELQLPAGRNRGRNYRSEILPQWVPVQRQLAGVAKIDALIDVVNTPPALSGGSPFELSVTFPDQDPVACSCC